MERFITNKYFKFSKYLVAAVLLVISALALVAAWYAGYRDLPGDKGLSAGQVISVSTNHGLKTTNLVIGIIGLVLTVLLLANSKQPQVVITFYVLAIMLIITLLTTSTLGITLTTRVTVPKP